VFGEPLRFDQSHPTRPTRETYQAIADDIMARIMALAPQARAKL